MICEIETLFFRCGGISLLRKMIDEVLISLRLMIQGCVAFGNGIFEDSLEFLGVSWRMMGRLF
jgi:hypothetical protein